MPFVFAILALLFLVVAIRGTEQDMFALVKSEFWGTNSFVPWAAAIVILGSIGYAKPIRPITDAMIGLILLAILLGNGGGVFAQFNAALKNPVAPTADATTTALTPAQEAADSGNYNTLPTISATTPTGQTYDVPMSIISP